VASAVLVAKYSPTDDVMSVTASAEAIRLSIVLLIVCAPIADRCPRGPCRGEIVKLVKIRVGARIPSVVYTRDLAIVGAIQASQSY